MRTLALAVAVASLAASPALADGLLPIGGAFGNAIGCAFFMTGVAIGQDLVILTPDNFTARTATCHFEALVEQADSAFTLTASCHEGDTSGVEQIAVRGEAEAGYTVTIAGAEMQWGPLIACPGAAEVFLPLGTPV